MTLHLALLIILIVVAVLAAMTKNFLYAAMWLASVSVTLTVIMFTMNAPWAGVFELSVCAGLITVLFASTASMVGAGSKYARNERKYFRYLPLALLAFGVFVWYFFGDYNFTVTKTAAETLPVGNYIWNTNRLAILGQLCIFVAGVLMVKAFFLWRDENND